MAVLTWRNVDAPQGAAAIDGLRLMSQLLDRSAAVANTGVTGFRQDQQMAADRLALLNSTQYQDSEAARAALQSGAMLAGVDRSVVSPEALALLNKRPASLAHQESTATATAAAQYAQSRREDGDQRMDAAAPALRGLMLATDDRSRAAAASNPELGNDHPSLDISLLNASKQKPHIVTSKSLIKDLLKHF